MNNEEKRQLANTVVTGMDALRPEDIKPWLAAFVSTHSKELIFEVNLLIKDDLTYKDAIRRMNGWLVNNPKTRVSWSHVSPATEASLRDAASWRSAPFSSRNNQGHACRDASALWGDRAFLNMSGVSLQAWTGSTPWANTEVADLIRACRANDDMWIVLCADGNTIDGLRTWPREGK